MKPLTKRSRVFLFLAIGLLLAMGFFAALFWLDSQWSPDVRCIQIHLYYSCTNASGTHVGSTPIDFSPNETGTHAAWLTTMPQLADLEQTLDARNALGTATP